LFASVVDQAPSLTFNIELSTQAAAHLTAASAIHLTATMMAVPTTARTAICFRERTLPLFKRLVLSYARFGIRFEESNVLLMPAI
jgi:hypothetical protein